MNTHVHDVEHTIGQAISLLVQIGALVAAICVGRFLIRSRGMIWLVALIGAFVAMVALMFVDGQGAFVWLLVTPLIYAFAVIGRNDLNATERLKPGERRLLDSHFPKK